MRLAVQLLWAHAAAMSQWGECLVCIPPLQLAVDCSSGSLLFFCAACSRMLLAACFASITNALLENRNTDLVSQASAKMH